MDYCPLLVFIFLRRETNFILGGGVLDLMSLCRGLLELFVSDWLIIGRAGMSAMAEDFNRLPAACSLGELRPFVVCVTLVWCWGDTAEACIAGPCPLMDNELLITGGILSLVWWSLLGSEIDGCKVSSSLGLI